MIAVSAVLLSFITDATSDTMKVTRAMRRRGHAKAAHKH